MSREPVMNGVADICPSTYGNVGNGFIFFVGGSRRPIQAPLGRRPVDEAEACDPGEEIPSRGDGQSPSMNHRSCMDSIRSQTDARLLTRRTARNADGCSFAIVAGIVANEAGPVAARSLKSAIARGF